MFPSDKTYAVGDCATGWLPFPTSAELSKIRYSNGVGDRATWEADDLTRAPVTSETKQTDRTSTQDTIGEGTFIVNEDIRPGRYRARALNGQSCYWARLRDDSGDSDGIIANNLTAGAASVTIKSTDGAFQTSGCTAWTLR